MYIGHHVVQTTGNKNKSKIMNTFGKVIGKGAFSTAYLQSDNKTVVLKSVDYVKECNALGWFPKSRYLPKIEVLDSNLYKMEYYPKVASLKDSLKPSQYTLYLELRGLKIPYCKNPYNLADFWRKEFKTVKNKTVKNLLLDVVDSMANYGTQFQFEISPRNVAVKNGNLILLDCFFIQDQLNEVRTNKKF